MTHSPAKLSDSLLPCPFCGLHATLHDVSDARGPRFEVFCDGASNCDVAQRGKSEAEAIAAWNSRTLTPSAGHKAAAEEIAEVFDYSIDDLTPADLEELQSIIARCCAGVDEQAAKIERLRLAVGNLSDIIDRLGRPEEYGMCRLCGNQRRNHTAKCALFVPAPDQKGGAA